ncbi:MAG TPA: GNAT family N-acetyltransferase [Bacillota bacterium]|jgi:ribosomal-protein-alanine N-acetyltransferase|nr:GNAT family N-acetyltransferase [Fastidiosipila sp.]HPX93132.1 GNAT family N-acetyltransferase [Bacillota bacterium]HQB81375.1 GNAT family N-acetyltransferase [Bacillota bacterium]
MVHKGTVRLETERLILRRFTVADAEAMFKNWASDPEVTKYLSWEPHVNIEETREILRTWVNSYDFKNYYSWGIEIKDSETLIGSIAVVEGRENIRLVHIGYCIGKPWWHQGYVSEALAELIRFFFEEVGVNRIESCHEPANTHSGDVMKKCGMQYEGLHRQSIYKPDGQFPDACYYAILAEDYRKR